MKYPKNNQEFYDCLDSLCARMRDAGMSSEAERISTLIHKVAWTTSSELFGELKFACRDALASPAVTRLSSDVKDDLENCLCILADVIG
jgi:hypothetical protein